MNSKQFEEIESIFKSLIDERREVVRKKLEEEIISFVQSYDNVNLLLAYLQSSSQPLVMFAVIEIIQKIHMKDTSAGISYHYSFAPLNDHIEAYIQSKDFLMKKHIMDTCLNLLLTRFAHLTELVVSFASKRSNRCAISSAPA